MKLKFKKNFVEELLFSFVSKFKHLYSEQILSGFHELLHLTDLTLQFGPLNSLCLFQFEELNRKISRFIKGTDLIVEEFIKIFTIAQYLTKLAPLIKNADNKINNFIN